MSSDVSWIDISVTLRSGMVHWPDDPPVSIVRVRDVAHGDPATLASLSLGSHSGTHIDAPLHFLADGVGIDSMPLDATVGRARVVDIVDPVTVTRDELARHDPRPDERILLRTQNSSRVWGTDRFVPDFVSVSTAAARLLVERRVRTVGVDYLSVGSHEVHRLLLGAGIWIIEGLDLARAPVGEVELVCLPLRIANGDGGPARAILRPVHERNGR